MASRPGRYLITGVAGFIGSALLRELLARGVEVRGLDNLSTGRRENMAGLERRFDFRQTDILDSGGLRDACTGIDYVLHQAAISSVPRSVKDPAGANRANVEGTLNVLMAARDAGVRRVVYAASSSAYGDTPTLPKQEDMLPRPLSPYAVSKLAGEQYAAAFWNTYGLETVSLRYFNVFGPRQDPDSPYSAVLARFITQMLDGEQPTIFGDGEQTRDFTYIDNAVAANLLACAAPAEQVCGKTFNIATGERHSLHAVYRMLQGLTGYAGEPAYATARAGDVRDSQADVARAVELLGYRPEVGVEEGLRRTVEWYREQRRGEAALSGRKGV
jgi:nucleoside-diphosphate-sugar epimerase